VKVRGKGKCQVIVFEEERDGYKDKMFIVICFISNFKFTESIKENEGGYSVYQELFHIMIEEVLIMLN
jgi:hypothetical protein